MGFGWLFLGYVISFLLESAAAMLNIRYLVRLLGYALILRGLWELRKYNSAFRVPLCAICVLLPETVFCAVAELGETFLWRLPFVTDGVMAVMKWVDFGLILTFHFTLYYAVASIAKSVGLLRTVRDAVFDTVVGVGYAALRTVSALPALASASATLAVPLTVFLLFWRICDLCLLISCCKNICPAGDEDQPAKPYRWNFLNRMGERFANNFHRAADSTRAAQEERLRNKQERKNRKSRGNR